MHIKQLIPKCQYGPHLTISEVRSITPKYQLCELVTEYLVALNFISDVFCQLLFALDLSEL